MVYLSPSRGGAHRAGEVVDFLGRIQDKWPVLHDFLVQRQACHENQLHFFRRVGGVIEYHAVALLLENGVVKLGDRRAVPLGPSDVVYLLLTS